MSKLLRTIVKVLAFLPLTPVLRGKIYKLIKGRHVKIGKGFQIGFGSFIDADIVEIGDYVILGNLVRIKLLDRFEIGSNSGIGSSTIICGTHDYNKFAERNFVCGTNVGILCSHYFDVVAPITIGNYVTIAGKWTQFYTHSFDLVPNRLDGSIVIGNHVYIGADCLINLGVHICDHVVLQGGTCVNKSIEEPGVYASNTLVKRGEVRQYDKLFADSTFKELSTGINVFLKQENADLGRKKHPK